MILIGEGPGSVGGANGFLLLIGLKYNSRSTIPRKSKLWSQLVMAMTLS